MNNFYKENQLQNPMQAYYPDPINIDEETGKISVQSHSNASTQPSQNQNNFSSDENSQSSPQQPKQSFPNNMNMEKIMSMLKGGSSNDMLSAMLASGMKGNAQQNPMMAQALSKLISPTKKSGSSATQREISPTTFEEM